MSKEDNFKVCPNCGFVWADRKSFMNDHEVSIIGYQVNFKKLKSGLFLFNHSCMGTLALKVSIFEDLYNGPIFQKRMTGTEACRGHCLHQGDLDACPVACECAYVREIIQKLKK
jgi:hypothetical protein